MSSTIAYSVAPSSVITEVVPCVSILMPFEPKMTSKKELHQKIDIVARTVGSELSLRFSPEQSEEIIRRLSRVLSSLNYLTYKRSIAIFISRSTERVYYLDLRVKIKVVVGNPFHLSDLVRNKVERHEFLALVLNEKWTKIYHGNATKVSSLVSNVAEHVYDYAPESCESCNLKDEDTGRLDRFLYYTNENLSMLLSAYPFPLFVIGTQKIISRFRKICTNKTNIVGYISANLTSASETVIGSLVMPHVANWSLVKEHFLFNKLHTAQKEGQLATGIGEVWKAASRKNGKLLIVENGYMNDGTDGNRVRAIFRTSKNLYSPFCIADEIDQLIEKILEAGGDVEFVEDGSLADYNHIALIREY